MTDTVRADAARTLRQLRPIVIERGWSARQAEGSALICVRRHQGAVHAPRFTNGVPRWLTGKGKGWVTAEYAMLAPCDEQPQRPGERQGSHRRPHPRDLAAHRPCPAAPSWTRRRSVRTPSSSTATCCRRTAAPAPPRSPAPTSRWRDAIEWGRRKKFIAQKATPLFDSVAAVSVGIIDGEPMLDLAYVEDVRAETDMNVVVTGRGLFVEVQGTAEGRPSTSASWTPCSSSASTAARELRPQPRGAAGESGAPAEESSEGHPT